MTFVCYNVHQSRQSVIQIISMRRDICVLGADVGICSIRRILRYPASFQTFLVTPLVCVLSLEIASVECRVWR